MQPLGKVQKEILVLLLERGPWHRSCWWSWNGAGNTERRMLPLVNRGLVQRGNLGSERGSPIWRLTRRGVADALNIRGERSHSPGEAAPDRPDCFSRHGHGFMGKAPSNLTHHFGKIFWTGSDV